MLKKCLNWMLYWLDTVEQYGSVHVYCTSFMGQSLGRNTELTKTWPLLSRSSWISSIPSVFTTHINVCPLIQDESDTNCVEQTISKHRFMCFSCDIKQVILDNLDFCVKSFLFKTQNYTHSFIRSHTFQLNVIAKIYFQKKMSQKALL